jgi:hypothetical protein
LRILSVITQPDVIEGILQHLDLPTEPPSSSRAPPAQGGGGSFGTKAMMFRERAGGEASVRKMAAEPGECWEVDAQRAAELAKVMRISVTVAGATASL